MAWKSRVISVSGIRSRKLHDEDLFRRVAHRSRVVHHQRARVDALENVRVGDVGHVEGRILPQQHDVQFGQVRDIRLAEREVVAGFVAYRQRLDRGASPCLPRNCSRSGV